MIYTFKHLCVFSNLLSSTIYVLANHGTNNCSIHIRLTSSDIGVPTVVEVIFAFVGQEGEAKSIFIVIVIFISLHASNTSWHRAEISTAYITLPAEHHTRAAMRFNVRKYQQENPAGNGN